MLKTHGSNPQSLPNEDSLCLVCPPLTAYVDNNIFGDRLLGVFMKPMPQLSYTVLDKKDYMMNVPGGTEICTVI